MPLTDTAVRKIKPGDKSQRIFDAGGLYLEVSPAGGKWWRLKYRFGGKEKHLSLSVYPDTGLAEARTKRDEARKLLARAIDPGAHRKATKAVGKHQAANSFEVIAHESGWRYGRPNGPPSSTIRSVIGCRIMRFHGSANYP